MNSVCDHLKCPELLQKHATLVSYESTIKYMDDEMNFKGIISRVLNVSLSYRARNKFLCAASLFQRLPVAVAALIVSTLCHGSSFCLVLCRGAGAGLPAVPSLHHQELPGQRHLRGEPPERAAGPQLPREVQRPLQIQTGKRPARRVPSLVVSSGCVRLCAHLRSVVPTQSDDLKKRTEPHIAGLR